MSARIHPTELADARRHVTGEAEVHAFVARQRTARLRTALMRSFYGRYPCRMGALHLLAMAGIAVTRFAAMSPTYDAIAGLLQPTDEHGAPRTPMWASYVQAFEDGRPKDYLEERWLLAHVADMEAVKAAGWDARFAREAAAHPGDPTWASLADHMAVTLGTRVHDREALAGEMALETAMATALLRVVREQVSAGLGLVRTHVVASARAVIFGGPWVPAHLPTDRSLVWTLCGATARVVRVSRVMRTGIRRRARGAAAPGGEWSLRPSLAEVLGAEMARLDPGVDRLFDAMDRYEMTASVHLYHRLGRWAAWLGTLFIGQGMYEEDLDQVDARFKLFRREDGSLHFVREFWCADAIRVFDSDFVVRDVDGKRTLLEVFTDLGVAAQMRTERLDDGGVAMTIARLFVRGVPIGVGPFRVCFETRPDHAAGPDRLKVTGVLELAPRGGLGRWFWRSVVGLPERIGEIRYFARPSAARPQIASR